MSRSEETVRRQRRPPMALPAQVRPVARGEQPDETPHGTGDGVEAAQSRCAHLRGLARQMCYATLYGVSV